MIHLNSVFSVDMDHFIYTTDEHLSSQEPNSSGQEGQPKTEHSHVSKIERHLKKSTHFSFLEKIINGIEIHITSR